METLQKSFRHVFSSAIPSIAIPLLKNGCADTEVDRHWLMHEISSMKPNPVIEPLSVSVMKDYAEALFTPEFLTNQFDIPTRPDVTGGMAIKSMLQGGKRMRPLLTLTSYTAYAKNFSRQIADQLMLAVECFHKASLIHDDIEDDDDYRYHQKTVHHENGVPLAINLGDYLIGQGYRKLSLLPVSGDIKLRLFDLFSSNHIELTVGQGEELALTKTQAVHDVNQTLNIFRQKTGSAIRVSLLAGAIAAEAPENDRNALGEFADLFGIAYQIRDDLTEFRCTATDQQSASYPFLKSLLVDEHQVTAATHQEWKELIKTHQIDREADIILAQTLAQMTSGLENIQSRQLRLALLNIINRYFDLK
jgi:geranylgeranyl pyrophosphate synthase